MGGIVETQVGDFSLGEAFAIGLAKSLAERILAPLIGNGSYMSGGIKLIGAWGLPKFLKGDGILGSRTGRIIGTALAVDGVEDIIQALFSSFFGGAGNESQSSPMIV